MPTIIIIDGIIIEMHPKQKEHNPPHIHAIYGGFTALFNIRTGEHIKGLFPSKQTRIVSQFIKDHSEGLLKIWETQDFKK